MKPSQRNGFKANPVLSPGHPPGFTTGGKAPADPMQTETNPTLLEIACKSRHWSEYLQVDGLIEAHELAVTDSIGKLMQMQDSGFSESYLGDLYDSKGHLISENLLIQIEPSGGVSEIPTIVVGGILNRTADFRKITSDTLVGPFGWYVVVRSTERGGE